MTRPLSTAEQEAMRWVDSRRDHMVALTERWATINSGSYHREGLLRMAATMAEDFAVLGGETESLELKPQEVINAQGKPDSLPLGPALRIRKRASAPFRVLLAGHMDTVFGPAHPFQAVERSGDNIMIGPGVADLKGGLAVMLTALQALEQSPLAGNIGWEILLNPDEEIGSPGSASLFVEAAKRNQVGLVYEPALADGTLAGQRKGSGNFTLVVHGRAAHAGRDHAAGRNAIVLLAEFTQALNALNGQKPGVTVNPGKIEGGGAVNIVPDLAILRFNVRVGDKAEQEWVDAQLTSLVQTLSAREGFHLHLHGTFSRPPKPIDPATDNLCRLISACAQTLSIPLGWQPSGGCCDGNNLFAAGLPNVDTLGVRGGAIHSAQEFVLLDSFTERAKLSTLILLRLAAGEWMGAAASGG